ncbi:MAG TPA: flippase-like domain-containing protein [Solirubrobacteraceae bacterium]|jgi:uncharacterized protein (TIRG00374 family)
MPDAGTPTSGPVSLPTGFDPRRVRRQAVLVIGAIGLLVLVALLAPGLGEVRTLLKGASVPWLAVATLLELLSCLSYVAMFRPVFCRTMSRTTAWEIAWSELGVGSLVPASGAGGLALGAWALRQGGMPAERIARRSVAFFLIKSAVNFATVAIVGTAVAVGLFGDTGLSLWLTALPAALSVLVFAAVIAIARRGRERLAPESAGRVRRAVAASQRAIVRGAAEAEAIVRSRDLRVIGGAIGYYAFDNVMLYATFKAVGHSPAIEVVLLGYLLGQLGGLLPLPGGIGGIDGGLIGALVVYGAPAAASAAAVFAFRIILFWLPLVIGAYAFVRLRRALNQPGRPDLCADAAAG